MVPPLRNAVPGKTRRRHGSRRSTAKFSDVGRVPGRDDRGVVADGRAARSRTCPTPSMRVSSSKCHVGAALGDAGVVVVGPVAARDVRAVLQVRALGRRRTGRDPADERLAVPLPQRVQDAGARPALMVDGCDGAPHDSVGHGDERGRDFLEGGHGAKTYTPARDGRARGVSQRLEGRRILVVGAGTRPSDDPDAPIGNGRAISVLAAREGAAVVCADLDATPRRRPPGSSTPKAGTRRRSSATSPTRPTARGSSPRPCAALGGLDGVVCNVGIGLGRGLDGTTVEEWDLVHAVNVRSHFLVCRAALPVMDDGGAIVFISSVAGLKPGTRIPAYDTTKAALAGLSRHVALEGSRRGIRANVVAPGSDRHAARPPGDAGPAEPRPYAGTARPPGDGVGGCGAGRVPLERRRELRHRARSSRSTAGCRCCEVLT